MSMENLIGLDHNYSHHWSEVYKTDTSHARPIQWLLPSCRPKDSHKATGMRGRPAKSSSSEGSDDEVDVESLDEVMSPSASGSSWSYDVQRARLHMNETERHALQNVATGKHAASSLRSEIEWEDHLNKSTWSLVQTKVFTKLVKILEDEKLARLAYKGVNNEPIARRLSLDRSAACFRRVMAEFAWDQKLAQWLHSLMINRLPPSMLASYLDLIQTLRSKVPTLVERMIMPSARETNSGSSDSLNLLLKRPWEPTLMKSSFPKQRLPDPPVILMVPNSPYASSPAMAHRKRFWCSYLGGLGKLVQVTPPDAVPGTTVLAYLEQLASVVRARIKSLRKKNPERPIVLVGWHTASVLSCHVSLVEKVSAIVCLGFPMSTLNGPRGTVDDVLCDLSTPTLFVIGDEADSCDINDLEDVREQLLTESQSSLLAIPGADDALKVSDRIKRKACVTQHMVDKMIIDHISKFLHSTLTKRSDGVWRLADQAAEEDRYTDQKMSDASYGRIKRERDMAGDGVSEIKRRRLSSTTTAKISEVLSGQKKGASRDGTKSPVQGVTFNLQTGSISGLTTVPTVLGRSKSISKETSQPTKHGKSGSKSKNQARSITIDLTKDASSQLNAHYRAIPDKTLLATESQTEAAVATILGNGSSEKTAAPPNVTEENPDVHARPPESAFLPATSSAFTRLGASNFPVTASNFPGRPLVSTPTTPASGSTQTTKVSPNSVTMTIGGNMGQFSRQKKTFTNTKFSSTLISPKPAISDNLSTINKQHWGFVGGSGKVETANRQTTFPGKFSPFSQQNLSTSSHVTSRSRKEERETLQATAILEKLTSSLGTDEEDPTTAVLRDADGIGQRRHSYDSTFLQGKAQIRGRVRTRGGSIAQPRQATQKRRKTINEERPTPPSTFQTKTKKNPDIRYVMTSDMSAALSDAAAKAAAASGKIFQKHPGITIIPREKTFFPKTQSTNPPVKPSILPVYAISHAAPKTSQSAGIGLRGVVSPSTNRQALVSATSTSKTTVPATASVSASQPGSQKLYVTQKVPVKFPGSIPGSNYTFVTIPALSGPAYKPANVTVKPTVVKKSQPATAKSRPEPRVIKYSVVSRASGSTLQVTASAPSKVTQSTSRAPVNLRDKAHAKGTVKMLPQVVSNTVVKQPGGVTIKKTVFTSPSVVLRKLWSDTIADISKDSQSSPQTAKRNNST